jgi:hypothetical protein
MTSWRSSVGRMALATAFMLLSATAGSTQELSGIAAESNKQLDGTVYAGTSPNSREAMYAMPADAPSVMGWEEAMNFCSTLDAHGHRDWRVPTKRELNVLYNNRAPIVDLIIPASLPRAGTGRLRRAAAAVPGFRYLRTGLRLSTSKETMLLCGVCRW